MSKGKIDVLGSFGGIARKKLTAVKEKQDRRETGSNEPQLPEQVRTLLVAAIQAAKPARVEKFTTVKIKRTLIDKYRSEAQRRNIPKYGVLIEEALKCYLKISKLKLRDLKLAPVEGDLRKRGDMVEVVRIRKTLLTEFKNNDILHVALSTILSWWKVHVR